LYFCHSLSTMVHEPICFCHGLSTMVHGLICFFAMVYRLWSMDLFAFLPWSIDYGPWTYLLLPWSIGYGPWTYLLFCHGLSAMVHGLICFFAMVHRLWSMDLFAFAMVYGLLTMVSHQKLHRINIIRIIPQCGLLAHPKVNNLVFYR
jgi:hypothetical protein